MDTDTQVAGKTSVFETIRGWFPHMVGVSPYQALLSFKEAAKASSSSPPSPSQHPAAARPSGKLAGPVTRREGTRKAGISPASTPSLSPPSPNILTQEGVMATDQADVVESVGPPQAVPVPPASQEPFWLEEMRLEIVHALSIKKVDERGQYVLDPVMERFVLPHTDGVEVSLAEELARRFSERTIDVVLSCGEYSGIFGASLTRAVMKTLPKGKVVMQRRFGKVPGPLGKEEYRVLASDGTQLPLSNKRVILAVSVITRDNWAETLEQLTFFRGNKASTSWVGVACLLKIGNLPDLPTGVQMEAIANFS